MFENIKRFAKTTSLKGVARILNNEIVFLKILWICSVLTSFVCCMWQVSIYFSKVLKKL